MKKIRDKIQYNITHTTDEIINGITLVVDILTTIIFILTLIFKTDFMYGLYWIFIILFFIVDIISIMHWDVDGLKAEKSESNKMIRGFRDATAITIIFSGLGFLTIVFLETINKSISKNIYVIIILYCLLGIAQFFNRLMIQTTIRDSSKYVKKFYEQNNKEK